MPVAAGEQSGRVQRDRQGGGEAWRRVPRPLGVPRKPRLQGGLRRSGQQSAQYARITTPSSLGLSVAFGSSLAGTLGSRVWARGCLQSCLWMSGSHKRLSSPGGLWMGTAHLMAALPA